MAGESLCVLGAFVSQDGCSTVPQARWLKATKVYSLTILEARSLKSRCWLPLFSLLLRVKTRASCRLVPTSHPHSPTAIAGLTSFPRFRLASRLESSTISSSGFFKVSRMDFHSSLPLLHLKSNPGPLLEFSSPGM